MTDICKTSKTTHIGKLDLSKNGQENERFSPILPFTYKFVAVLTILVLKVLTKPEKNEMIQLWCGVSRRQLIGRTYIILPVRHQVPKVHSVVIWVLMAYSVLLVVKQFCMV